MCETMPKRLLTSELQGALRSLELSAECVATLVARVARREGRWRTRMPSFGRNASVLRFAQAA